MPQESRQATGSPVSRPPRRRLSSRLRLFLAASLFTALAGGFTLPAQDQSSPLPRYPGKAWYTGTWTTASLLSNLAGWTDGTTGSGAEIRTGWELQDLPDLGGFEASLYGLYRYLAGPESTVLMYPGLGLQAAWRFDIERTFSIKGIAGFQLYGEAALGPLDTSVNPVSFPAGMALGSSLDLGLELQLHLSGQLYLTLGSNLTVPLVPNPPAENRPAILGVNLGFRERQAHWIPVPPVASAMTPSTLLFSPDADGENDQMDIDLQAPQEESIKSWTLSILDENKVLFRSWSGEGVPPDKIPWDGLSDSGMLVESASELSMEFRTRDILDRETLQQNQILVDILVMKDGDNYKIRLPNIEFPANSARLNDAQAASFLEQNRKVLTRLAQIIQKFPDYGIVIEGHSNATRWQTARSLEEEQKKELVPLSEFRAQAVKDALVELGIQEQRMKIVGMGASKPLVPFDSPDKAKNRRVEFLLVKPRK